MRMKRGNMPPVFRALFQYKCAMNMQCPMTRLRYERIKQFRLWGILLINARCRGFDNEMAIYDRLKQWKPTAHGLVVTRHGKWGIHASFSRKACWRLRSFMMINNSRKCNWKWMAYRHIASFRAISRTSVWSSKRRLPAPLFACAMGYGVQYLHGFYTDIGIKANMLAISNTKSRQCKHSVRHDYSRG